MEIVHGGILGGRRANCRNLREKAKYAPPLILHLRIAMLIVVFVVVRVFYGLIPKRGHSRGGVTQMCRKLHAKFAQNCQYFVACIRGRVRKTVTNLSRI